ncbi:Uncharacterized protein SCF082_LOCUS36833 [Durusdinium trenchii]|uniref:Uncharacterized protein n=2 Tax=Durusdinium trenchii TaxID=1381693 RepID=A0ABP0PK43_9DINO
MLCHGRPCPQPPRIRRSPRTTTHQAVSMHATVSPARWCVTFGDLQYLHSEVQEAIQDGQIPEDSSGAYGPSIYVVNEKYIKPITALAGKMSWALMMNPQCLESDLFITHAWQEGIFEFIEKVLTSWPARARHAWCCMLANPQNLDIAALLHSPSMSPFAVALQSSKYMLVVPNRDISVYTRLWCGYEAYLAYEGKKIIRTARRSISRDVFCAWAMMLPALSIAVALGLAAKQYHWNVDIYLMVALFLAGVVSENFGYVICLIANHLGLAASTALAVGWTMKPDWLQVQGLPDQEAYVVQRVIFLTAVAFFLVSEVDRLHYAARELEGLQLRKHYQGSTRYASCSERHDEEKICQEIGEKAHSVDQVIQVLISAGMSSPALREAQMQGVSIEHAGDAQFAIPSLFLGPQLLLGIWQLGRYATLVHWKHWIGWQSMMLQALSVFARLCFIILLCWRSIDERCFMLKVMTKLVSVMVIPGLVAFCLGASLLTTVMIVFIAFHISFLLVLVFAFLGIRGTLHLPGGPVLVQFFLTRFQRGSCDAPDTDAASRTASRTASDATGESTESTERGESSDDTSTSPKQDLRPSSPLW